MGIPSKKTIRDRIRWLDKIRQHPDSAVRIIRGAMEWAENYEESSDQDAFFDYFYEGEGYRGVGSGSPYQKLEDFRFHHDRVYAVLKILDRLLETHGVEYAKTPDDDFNHFEGFEYLNTGDTYAGTVVYDYSTRRWEITSWGDIVEADMERFGD